MSADGNIWTPEDWRKRWPDFSPAELLSPSGRIQYLRGGFLLQPTVVDKLQELRKALGLAVLVNHGPHKYRGYRSAEENKIAGGRYFSRHVQGIAFDITVQGRGCDELAIFAKEKMGWRYVESHPDKNYVHIDMGVRAV